MKKLVIAAIAAVAAGLLHADPAVQGLYTDQSLQASYNELGVQLVSKAYYRLPLIKRDGILWESTKIDVGIQNNLSPAYDFVGGFIDIEPIAVFDLQLIAQFAGYYSGLGYGFRTLQGYDSAFDTAAQDAIPGKDTAGYVLSAAPTLKFAIKDFAFSDTLHVNYFNVDGGTGYFYETIANCPLGKNDVELYNDAYALYSVGKGIYVGLNDSILDIPGSGYVSHSLQALGAIDKSLSGKLELYAALTAGTYLEDRYLQYAFHAGGQVGIVYAF